MPHQASQRNPFMLLLHPEVILAAVEKSERLGQLNRHLCRPLDRPAPAGVNAPAVLRDDDDDEALPSAE
jgi:hypothetical protein